jgi:hypothetical protein
MKYDPPQSPVSVRLSYSIYSVYSLSALQIDLAVVFRFPRAEVRLGLAYCVTMSTDTSDTS